MKCIDSSGWTECVGSGTVLTRTPDKHQERTMNPERTVEPMNTSVRFGFSGQARGNTSLLAGTSTCRQGFEADKPKYFKSLGLFSDKVSRIVAAPRVDAGACRKRGFEACFASQPFGTEIC